MNCAESEILIHALIDGELDAGHAREVESHVATCPSCAGKLSAFRGMRETMASANLKQTAPALLRGRIEAALTLPPARANAVPDTRPTPSLLSSLMSSLRSVKTFVGGFAVGAALSAAVAASLLVAVVHDHHDRTIADDVVSAHLRSLQAGHLTDVQTSDQHTVKPWFNGKINIAPPVIDLTAEGFTLIGGRLDTLDGKDVASVVYQRRKHIINLFVAQGLGTAQSAAKSANVHGFNIIHWTEDGLDLWAVSDIEAGELDEFSRKIAAALRPPAKPS